MACALTRFGVGLACRGFPNTYTMGKHFTEQLVAEFHKTQLPAAVAIVRPTLVCGLAGAPYPGYCGNLAGREGHIGAAPNTPAWPGWLWLPQRMRGHCRWLTRLPGRAARSMNAAAVLAGFWREL